MKKLETIICSHHWDAIREILGALGATATLREVKTFGRVPAKRGVYRGSTYTMDTSPELELAILVQDDLLEAAVSALSRVTGGAEILVTPVAYLVRGGVTPRGREAAIRPTLGSLRVVDSPALVTAAVARS